MEDPGDVGVVEPDKRNVRRKPTKRGERAKPKAKPKAKRRGKSKKARFGDNRDKDGVTYLVIQGVPVPLKKRYQAAARKAGASSTSAWIRDALAKKIKR